MDDSIALTYKCKLNLQTELFVDLFLNVYASSLHHLQELRDSLG